MKYTVEVSEVHKVTCVIESKTPLNREQLLEKAEQMIETGVDAEPEYDYTLESDHWTTRDDEGNFIT